MHTSSAPRSTSWLLPGFLAAAGLTALMAVAGCGSSGPAGAAGSSAPITETGVTTDPVIAATGSPPGVVLTITGVTGQSGSGSDGAYFLVGDKPTVTFTIAKTNGAPWHLNEMADASLVMSGPTTNYQVVIPLQTDLVSRAVAQGEGTYTYTFATGIPATYGQPSNNTAAASVADGQLQGTALQAGTYTFGIAASWHYTVNGVQHVDAGSDTMDVIYGATGFTNHTTQGRQVVKNENCATCHVQIENHQGKYRDPALCVLCHTSGAKDPNGASIDFRVLVHRVHNGVHQPSVIGVSSNASGTRNYSATPVENSYEDEDDNGNPVVHNFSDVVFPVFPSFQSAMPRHAGHSALAAADKTKQGLILQGVVACYKCHGDPDGSGSQTAPSQGDNCYNAPTRRACGSCHDDINWANPYQNNGKTMPAQADDSSCVTCHAAKSPGVAATAPVDMSSGAAATLGALITTATGADVYEPATNVAHAHPLADPRSIPEATVVTTDANRALNANNGINFAISSLAGSAASYFASGEKPAITFTITDNSGANIPLYSLQAISTTLVGPTNNKQLVFPLASPKAVTVPVCDFSGRLVSTSTTNKGSMSRVVGSSVSETLKVQFTSATAFTVTAGAAGTARGDSATASVSLTASPSTNPANSSISAVELSSSAAAQTVTVAFTTASGVTSFTVTGTAGLSGSGTMPATTNASTRWTASDGSVAFTVTSGATAFTTGNNVYMTIFAAPSGGHKFAIVAGRTSFASGDRFYYETVDNSLTSYTYNLPMDLVLEFVGTTAAVSGETFTLGAVPYWGREAVYEALASTATTVSANAAARDRYVDLTSVTGFAANDYVILDRAGGVGTAEAVQIGSISGNRVSFKLPLRYAHVATATCEKVTLSQRLENTNYTLDAANRLITTTAGMTVARSVLVSYRTDGAFGWKRHNGDSVQAVYPPPPNDSADQAQAWGEWNGLAYQSGTYTASVWGSKPIYITRNNETQTYQLASNSANKDFSYGAAGTPTAYNLISSQANCEACHDQVTFHGGSRKGNDTCVVCHGVAGMEDWPAYAGGTPAATTSVSANFRTMLHKIHMGEELANASTWTVVGNGGTGHTYGEVVFPVKPGGVKACDKCHGADNEAWKEPAIRAHAAQTTPTLNWKTVCSSCHDSAGHAAHMELMTSVSGAESCIVCHGEGKSLAVDKVHQNR